MDSVLPRFRCCFGSPVARICRSAPTLAPAFSVSSGTERSLSRNDRHKSRLFLTIRSTRFSLLDGDRFEGRFRNGVHAADVSDLMRRMVKERLLKFDGKPLFPERIAYTVPYRLSEAEARLYTAVTDYVREEFNRAEALANAKRAGTVGFALTLLQRCLASSKCSGAAASTPPPFAFTASKLDADDIADLDDAPEQEAEDAEVRILDQATAARSIVELAAVRRWRAADDADCCKFSYPLVLACSGLHSATTEYP